MSVAMTIIQLGGAYLRYLPFSSELSAEKIAELKKKILIWGVVSLTLNLFLFSEAANYHAWKISLSINWIPYFLLSLTVITKKFPNTSSFWGCNCFGVLCCTRSRACRSLYSSEQCLKNIYRCIKGKTCINLTCLLS